MKIGIFLSLGGLANGNLDTGRIVEHFRDRYPVYVYDDFFEQAAFDSIKATVCRENFDGVLLAGDSPRYYRHNKKADHLNNIIFSSGVNPNRIVPVNLREQLALVHDNLDEATEKALLLMEVAIARVLFSEDVKTKIISPQQSAVIFNPGPGAILAAERLLAREIRVYLVNSDAVETISGTNYYRSLKAIYNYVLLHPLTTVIKDATLSDLYGYAGDFGVILETPNGQKEINAGSLLFSMEKDSDFANQLRQHMHMDVDENGRLIALNPDTMPVYTMESGIFILPGGETLSAISSLADTAALAIISLLEKKEIHHRILISEINKEQCGGCGTCVKTCMFKASSIDPLRKISVIDEKRCKGCGNCVTACPTGARDLLTHPKKYLIEAIRILSRYPGESGKILAFLCEGCGYKAMDLAGETGIKYPAGILPLAIRCGGNIDTQLLLEAYHCGFDGIVICKCADGKCRNIVGDADLDRRANLFREVLRSRGINSDSLRIIEAFKEENNYCVQAMIDLFKELSMERGGPVE